MHAPCVEQWVGPAAHPPLHANGTPAVLDKIVVNESCGSAMPPRDCWCETPLALLISGVASRFAYEHAFSLLMSHGGQPKITPLVHSKQSDCSPLVDAFAVLQDGKGTSWSGTGSRAVQRRSASTGKGNSTVHKAVRYFRDRSM